MDSGFLILVLHSDCMLQHVHLPDACFLLQNRHQLAEALQLCLAAVLQWIVRFTDSPSCQTVREHGSWKKSQLRHFGWHKGQLVFCKEWSGERRVVLVHDRSGIMIRHQGHPMSAAQLSDRSVPISLSEIHHCWMLPNQLKNDFMPQFRAGAAG